MLLLQSRFCDSVIGGGGDRAPSHHRPDGLLAAAWADRGRIPAGGGLRVASAGSSGGIRPGVGLTVRQDGRVTISPITAAGR